MLDGISLKQSWGGEVKNIAVLVAGGVRSASHREILGVSVGTKEDCESWHSFLRYLKQRGLSGVRLITSDKCMGLVEALSEFFPEVAWQRCTVHFYRNVLKDVPRSKSREVAAMLKAVHAQENRALRQHANQTTLRFELNLFDPATCFEDAKGHFDWPASHLQINLSQHLLNRFDPQ